MSFMQILTLCTAISGAVLFIDSVHWKMSERENAKGFLAEIVETSRVIFPILAFFLIVRWIGLTLAEVLTLLTVVSGIVVLLDKVVWKSSGREDLSSKLTTSIEYSWSFFPVLVLVLVVRSFVFEPFRIPSGSMNPTLLEGDFIFVKKYTYGLRLPVTETKILETGSPERGDVVVFRLPSDPKINYIKRVVGLPGDTVHYERHRLTINGVTVPLSATQRTFLSSAVYDENLDGRVHDVVIRDPQSSRMDGTHVIPPGHYFMMGDNRTRSRDSRYPEVGFVAEEYLVGEATRVWMHWVIGWNAPDLGRIGTKIQ